MEKNGFLAIGKIVGVHGLRGAIKVYSYGDSLSVFRPGCPVLIKNTEGLAKTFIIDWVKPHKRVNLFSLKGLENRNQAEALVGAELLIAKATLPELEEGTYYWADLIGLSVFTIEKKYIGRIASIIPTGSNDVYVVKDPEKDDGNEILIPALASVVMEVDLERKIMRVDLPEGL
jgi:16S rRNA processing protein RimM